MLKYLNTALGAAALSLTLGGMPQAAFAQDSAEPIIIPTHNGALHSRPKEFD